MKKILTLVLIFLMITANIYSQNSIKNKSYEVDLLHFIKFKDGEIIFEDYTSDGSGDDYKVTANKYETINKYGLTYLKLDNGKTYLALISDDILVLYDSQNKSPVYYACGFNTEFDCSLNGYFTSASSELKEGNKVYSSSNIANLNLAEPWVEGVKGNGIGESITYHATGEIIFFFNGFVSYSKPELYKYNSRVKKIKITSTSNNFEEMIVDLQDTPNPQTIKLPNRSGYVTIEILDVYPGTKYSDTCIHGITCKVF